MAKITWKLKAIPKTIWSGMKWQWRKLKITRNSLFYNNFTNRAYIIDILMEPIFWFVENFTKVLGPFFVYCVWCLTASIVGISYWIGLPFWWKKCPWFTVILVLVGNWLLINICFHYYMASTTLPGQPPEGILIEEAASMCRKCISPKPPRTHHCSICNKCILRMDHHCPWLDNCIGHYNHRYFFMYMVYVCTGVLFVLVFGLEIFYINIWLEVEEELYGHPVRFNDSVMIESQEVPFENQIEESPVFSLIYHRSIIYMAILCTSVFFALGALSSWHARLITKGETSIESYVNSEETKRLKRQNVVYVNPYNFGPRKNWQLFLGLGNGRSWRHILLPSCHLPAGNGLSWTTVYSEREAQLQSVNVGGSDDAAFTPPVFELMKRKKPAECVDRGTGDNANSHCEEEIPEAR